MHKNSSALNLFVVFPLLVLWVNLLGSLPTVVQQEVRQQELQSMVIIKVAAKAMPGICLAENPGLLSSQIGTPARGRKQADLKYYPNPKGYINYQTVFEITDKGYQWWFPAIGLVGTAVIIILRNAVGVPDSKTRLVRVALWFSLIWTFAMFAVTFPQYYELRKKYKAQQYSVVEGVVENFKPMPYEGHENETFTVNGIRFEYSDYAISPGFNQTSSHGGPIKQGLQVRIGHIGNIILRLEVLK